MRNQKQPLVRARRAFAMLGVLGLIVTMVSMFLTAAQLRGEGDGSADVGILGLTLFSAERATIDGGTTASLRPGLGVLVVLVLIPTAVALLVYFRSKGKAETPVRD